VIIAGAGMAAALPGATAAITPIPVLGVPMEGKVMGGLDSILSMVQMPAGIPVGTLAVGRSGAINAAIMAASILALSDPIISRNLEKFRANQTASVIETPQN
jgi:5-(carboxyamino)imidazole ribonucleotide mutase